MWRLAIIVHYHSKGLIGLMKRDLKALVLAGGRGKRLENVSSNMNKCMLNFNGYPLVFYSLQNAVGAGVAEIVIIVGYRAEDIINCFGNSYEGTRIKYVIQREQRGLVHAIECAQDAIDGCDFMTFLGDEILIKPRHEEMLNLFYAEDLYVVCGVVKVEDLGQISKTYAIIQDGSSSIFRLVEKPKKPLNNIMGTGNCVFKSSIFEYIKDTPINPKRGEKELVDLIQCTIDEGNPVKSFDIGSGYININLEEDIAAMEQLLKSPA